MAESKKYPLLSPLSLNQISNALPPGSKACSHGNTINRVSRSPLSSLHRSRHLELFSWCTCSSLNNCSHYIDFSSSANKSVSNIRIKKESKTNTHTHTRVSILTYYTICPIDPQLSERGKGFSKIQMKSRKYTLMDKIYNINYNYLAF